MFMCVSMISFLADICDEPAVFVGRLNVSLGESHSNQKRNYERSQGVERHGVEYFDYRDVITPRPRPPALWPPPKYDIRIWRASFQHRADLAFVFHSRRLLPRIGRL